LLVSALKGFAPVCHVAGKILSEMATVLSGTLNCATTNYYYCYGVFIGQVILDKLSPVRTVVHKTQIIDNTFRNFVMEVIAGEPNFITTTREHGFLYKMDFSRVYWNPRLGTVVSSCYFCCIFFSSLEGTAT